jgi:mRNA interferase YafQ
MRTIERTTQFKRDYKRELKDVHRASFERDLVLIYRKLDNEVLQLVRVGSHSELSL